MVGTYRVYGRAPAAPRWTPCRVFPGSVLPGASSRERRNRRPGPRGARSGGRAEEVAQAPEAVPTRGRRAREMLERGRREVGPHAVGGLGEPLAQPIPQPPAAAPPARGVRVAGVERVLLGAAPETCRVRVAGVEQVPLGAGRTRGRRVLPTGRRVPVRWSGLRRPVVAEAFLVDHDLARHDANRAFTGQGPLDQRRRLGQPAGAGQGGRLRHGGEVLTVHGRLPFGVGESDGPGSNVLRIPSVHHPLGWCTTMSHSRYSL